MLVRFELPCTKPTDEVFEFPSVDSRHLPFQTLEQLQFDVYVAALAEGVGQRSHSLQRLAPPLWGKALLKQLECRS